MKCGQKTSNWIGHVDVWSIKATACGLKIRLTLFGFRWLEKIRYNRWENIQCQ